MMDYRSIKKHEKDTLYNPKVMRQDCFAFNPNEDNCCSALDYCFCSRGYPCSFYKTKKQHLEDLEKYPYLDMKTMRSVNPWQRHL